MIQIRDQTIKRALEVAFEQCQGDADAYLSRLLRTLDGTLGDALAFCWGTIRQVERYANVPTLSTPRDFGLHHVEEHLLFTAANDALSHLDLVERLLEEVKSFSQQDVTAASRCIVKCLPDELSRPATRDPEPSRCTSRRTGPISKVDG